MLNNRYVKAVTRFLRLPAERSWPGNLLTPERTRKALEREQARADRTGSELSVVSFKATDPVRDRRMLLCLVEILQNRLRNTDEIGRLSEREICALLIATPAAGARLVVEQVLHRLPADMARPRYTIVTWGNKNSECLEAMAEDSPSEIELV